MSKSKTYRIYIRKAVHHDATNGNNKEVSITDKVRKLFFEEKDEGLNFIGKTSRENGSVILKKNTDWRFGGDFKKIVRAEGGTDIDDLYYIATINGREFELEIIKPNDNRYDVLSSLFIDSKLLHILINTQDDDTETSIDETITDPNDFQNGTNIIFYGVPGAGKSWTIENEFNLKSRSPLQVERVIFFPDYTYSDFVGQILPTLNDDSKLEYKFIPGAFTQILKRAYHNDKCNYFLIIEEINRGNAPAIFGDIFQLLDRDEKGDSIYGITNFDIAKEIFGNKDILIRIPKNLFILATMNTADQNVFTLDTAFQRRWELRHIKNDTKNANDMPICGSTITWKKFVQVINEIIIENSDEFGDYGDKRLGVFFANKSEIENKDKFSHKVLKYLFDDAFKMHRAEIFKENLKTADIMIETFIEKEADEAFKAIFLDEILKKLTQNDE